MRFGPPESEERALYAYAVAVAVALAVFLAWELWLLAPQQMPSPGFVGGMLSLVTVYLLSLWIVLLPFLLGWCFFRLASIDHPVWFAAYGAAVGFLLPGCIVGRIGPFLLLPAIAGAVGGATFKALFALGR